jgi:hypothetical protein
MKLNIRVKDPMKKQIIRNVRTLLAGLLFIMLSGHTTLAQPPDIETEITELSAKKWQWMADKDADRLADFFHDKAKFVHMGGTWGKDREVEIIRSGGIHYKKADIHEVMVAVLNENTAILWNRITLLAVVGPNEVTNPFMVTEVYVKEENDWKLADLTFSKLLSPE